jgi:hypothetical protein
VGIALPVGMVTLLEASKNVPGADSADTGLYGFLALVLGCGVWWVGIDRMSERSSGVKLFSTLAVRKRTTVQAHRCANARLQTRSCHHHGCDAQLCVLHTSSQICFIPRYTLLTTRYSTSTGDPFVLLHVEKTFTSSFMK